MKAFPDDDDDSEPYDGECRFTREQLEQKFEMSQRGKDVATFACYFVPNNFPLRCLFCDRTIVDHQSEVRIPVSTTFSTSVDELEHFKRGQTVDILKSSDHTVFGYLAVVLWLGAIACLVGFLVSGIISHSSGTAAVTAPVIMFALGTFFSVLPRRVYIEFDRKYHEIRISQYRVIWFCCCGDDACVPFANVIGIYNTESGSTCSSCCGQQPMNDISLAYVDDGDADDPKSAGQRRHVVLTTVEQVRAGREQRWWTEYLVEIGVVS